MNIEEQKAIENLKDFAYKDGWVQVGKAKIVLKLIEKQQAEIENLKEEEMLDKADIEEIFRLRKKCVELEEDNKRLIKDVKGLETMLYLRDDEIELEADTSELAKIMTQLEQNPDLEGIEYDGARWLKEDYVIPISVIQNKIDELNRRIDYLNTELTKCYIEREKLGTETDIDNNETAIFCMEQEREYRYEQKQVLKELLEERNK